MVKTWATVNIKLFSSHVLTENQRGHLDLSEPNDDKQSYVISERDSYAAALFYHSYNNNNAACNHSLENTANC